MVYTPGNALCEMCLCKNAYAAQLLKVWDPASFISKTEIFITLGDFRSIERCKGNVPTFFLA